MGSAVKLVQPPADFIDEVDLPLLSHPPSIANGIPRPSMKSEALPGDVA